MTKEKLRELVFINLGQASMCWSEWPAGVFQSTKAVELGEEIMRAIDEYVEEEEPGWNNPLVDYLDWEENKNKESEWQRRRRLEVMKEAEKKSDVKTSRAISSIDKALKHEQDMVGKIIANNDAVGFDTNGNPQFRYEGIYYTLDKDYKHILERTILRSSPLY